MRMRQSLSELERAFFEEAEADRLRRERLYRQAAQRSSKRRIERTHKAGSARFVVLVLVLLATAALVRGGFARTLTIPPDVRFADRFRALAAQARDAGRGLWSACGPA